MPSDSIQSRQQPAYSSELSEIFLAIIIEAALDKVYVHIYLHWCPDSELAILIDDKVGQPNIYKLDLEESCPGTSSPVSQTIINKRPIHIRKFQVHKLAVRNLEWSLKKIHANFPNK